MAPGPGVVQPWVVYVWDKVPIFSRHYKIGWLVGKMETWSLVETVTDVSYVKIKSPTFVDRVVGFLGAKTNEQYSINILGHTAAADFLGRWHRTKPKPCSPANLIVHHRQGDLALACMPPPKFSQKPHHDERLMKPVQKGDAARERLLNNWAGAPLAPGSSLSIHTTISHSLILVRNPSRPLEKVRNPSRPLERLFISTQSGR